MAWLTEEDGLHMLSDAVGIDIQLIRVKVHDNGFNIRAEEARTRRKIVVEIQKETTTNNDQLGKLITYAAGHDAKTVIWMVKEMSEKHRETINWLNENSSGDVAFFVIQPELYQIEDSKPALRLNVVCRPNEWGKGIRMKGQSYLH